MTNEPVWHGAVTLRWSKGGEYLLLGYLCLGEVYKRKRPADMTKPWTSYVSCADQEIVIPDFPTEAEAKAALLDAAVKGLCGE